MMKNYFENETTILPFDKVLSIHKNKDSLYICIGFDKGNGIGSSFPIDQLANYKLWLGSQSNPSETPTSCSCSEKANDSNHLPDVGKMVLSRDILQKIVDKVGCRYCTVDHLSQHCKNCYSYSNIKISDDFVKEINELTEESSKWS